MTYSAFVYTHIPIVKKDILIHLVNHLADEDAESFVFSRLNYYFFLNVSHFMQFPNSVLYDTEEGKILIYTAVADEQPTLFIC